MMGSSPLSFHTYTPTQGKGVVAIHTSRASIFALAFRDCADNQLLIDSFRGHLGSL